MKPSIACSLVVAAALAGCGGGGESAPTSVASGYSATQIAKISLGSRNLASNVYVSAVSGSGDVIAYRQSHDDDDIRSTTYPLYWSPSRGLVDLGVRLRGVTSSGLAVGGQGLFFGRNIEPVVSQGLAIPRVAADIVALLGPGDQSEIIAASPGGVLAFYVQEPGLFFSGKGVVWIKPLAGHIVRSAATYQLDELGSGRAKLNLARVNVAGDLLTTTDTASTLTRAGTSSPLDFTGLGMNALGHVVGRTSTGVSRHAVVRKGNVQTLLAEPQGALASEAWDISDEGTVVGDATFADGVQRAVLWKPTGEIVELSTLLTLPGGFWPARALRFGPTGQIAIIAQSAEINHDSLYLAPRQEYLFLLTPR